MPHQEDRFLRRDLAWTFVKLSTAVRDFTIELSVSRYRPDDIRSLRNLMQGVIRGILSIRPDTTLFDYVSSQPMESRSEDGSSENHVGFAADTSDELQIAMEKISHVLAPSVRVLIDAMQECVKQIEETLLHMGGARRLQKDPHSEKALWHAGDNLRNAMDAFDKADAELLSKHELPAGYSTQPEMVDTFLFVHPVRQAAEKVRLVVEKVLHMQQDSNRWRIWLPSYPLLKSLDRVNAQVRHDRGGLTAGFYFRSKEELEKSIQLCRVLLTFQDPALQIRNRPYRRVVMRIHPSP